MRVLLIEDDPSVSRSIQLILGQQGHACETADSGEAGLALAQSQAHDIILLDLSLPDGDGHGVLQQLRAAKVRTPVLILSGSDARDDKLKGLSIGADDYVTKPFDKDELLARMRAIIRRATGRTPSPRAAALDSVVLARRGQAAPWSFGESYTPVRSPGKAPEAAPAAPEAERPGPPAGMSSATSPTPSAPPVPVALPAPAADSGRIVVVGNAKGGTGKSTIVMHLIVALLQAGHKVASIDVDAAQGTLTRYLENRRQHARDAGPNLVLPEHEIVPQIADADGDVGAVDALIARLARSHAYVVVDTPGFDAPLSRRAHAWADVLITPINDSHIDLDALAEAGGNPGAAGQRKRYADTVRAANQARAAAGRPASEWLVLRNRLANLDARNRRQVAEALAAMARELGFRQGPGLRERVIYRELFRSGLTLLDLPHVGPGAALTMSHVAARQEIRQLLETVLAMPNAPAKRPGPGARRAVLKVGSG